ncbi:MAG: hypothetical protein U9O94_00610 [Nanoarchaeota archaeon]|nr:hypothetical protein [Nanoarchaeota archaeon]
MKKTYIISLFLVTLLALGVSAADLGLSTPASQIQKPGKVFSATFTVTNNGTVNQSGLTIALKSGLAGYNLNFTPSTFDANTDSPTQITVQGTIPDNIDTKRTGDAVGTSVAGVIAVSSGSTEIVTSTLTVIAESQLQFDDEEIKVKVDGDKEDLGPDDKRDEILPGSKVTFSGKILNLFSDADDEDVEIEDVEIEITIESIDDEGDDDLDDTEDIGDIKADDEESFSIEFEIPEDVDEGDYDVTVIVEGKDENGAKHRIEWDLILEVEKEKHDVQIRKSSVSPSKVMCSRDIRLFIDLKNQGTSDEDEVVVLIENEDLGLRNEDTSIPEIEEGVGEDTEYDKTYSLRIDEDVKAGTYPVKITVYYDTDEHSDETTVDLVVEGCQAADEEDEEEESDDVVIVSTPDEEDEEEGPEIITEPYQETTESSFIGSNTYLILLIIAIVVAVIVIIVLGAMMLKMKQTP